MTSLICSRLTASRAPEEDRNQTAIRRDGPFSSSPFCSGHSGANVKGESEATSAEVGSALLPQITQSVRLIDGELRLLDLKLAEWLGYTKTTQIRRLIERNSEEIQLHGVIATVAITPQAQADALALSTGSTRISA